MARLSLDLPDDFRRERGRRTRRTDAGRGADTGESAATGKATEPLGGRPHVERWLACWARHDTSDV